MGYYHSCAQRTDGSAWCWGNNAEGEVGNRTTTGTATPTKIANSIQAIVAGSYETMAIS